MPAGFEAFPLFASIQYHSTEEAGGSVLMSTRHLLTTSSCATMKGDIKQVWVGAIAVLESPANLHLSARLKCIDLAILALAEETKDVNPAPFQRNRSGGPPEGRARSALVGFGRDTVGSPGLRKVPPRTTPDAYCSKKNLNFESEGNLCFDGGSCDRDNRGPLVNSKAVVWGILSQADACEQLSAFASVVVDVSVATAWIDSIAATLARANTANKPQANVEPCPETNAQSYSETNAKPTPQPKSFPTHYPTNSRAHKLDNKISYK